jgi:hypothetical protein
MRVLMREDRPKSSEGLEPKILNESPPTPKEESADVKKHNEEFNQRADRAHESIANEGEEKEKVSPKFWSGESFFLGGAPMPTWLDDVVVSFLRHEYELIWTVIEDKSDKTGGRSKDNA